MVRAAVAAAALWPAALCSIRPRATIVCAMPKNAYFPYSHDDDTYLWDHRNEDLGKVADQLGRGVNSVSARLERLRTPGSAGYARLFGSDDDSGIVKKAPSLRPVRECIQRVLHDQSLDSRCFRFGYRDRFEARPRVASFTDRNDCVSGAERLLVTALPEHRIEFLLYKKRLVWHKALKLDHIFGTGAAAEENGRHRIRDVVVGYDAWAKDRKVAKKAARRRAIHCLGSEERLAAFLRELSRLRDGQMGAEDLIDLALSEEYFGPLGSAPLQALLCVLPDEHALLRASLISLLVRERSLTLDDL
jgi:hypothetical protein